LDRIDLQIEVPTLGYQELANRDPGEPSSSVRQRVTAQATVETGLGTATMPREQIDCAGGFNRLFIFHQIA